MAQTYLSPGVYRQEVLLKPPPALQTGVPGFVGFAGAPSGGNLSINLPVALGRKEDFAISFSNGDGSFLADAVAGFFDNGGTRCYVVAGDSATRTAQGLVDAMAALAPLEDVDLVAVPDASTLVTSDKTPDKLSIARVQAEMLTHCAQHGNRFAILDSLPAASVDDVINQCKQLVTGHQEPLNGALYFPWLVTSSVPNPVPPCGHVAGIYRRCDAKTGVFKAPANEEIFGVLDLETQIQADTQDKLNPARVNCLRAFPGRGIRVWGARTVGSVPPDIDWLYVNVRRLFLTVRRWIDLNMGWATFEPNDSRLWIRIQRGLTVFLSKLQSDGALQGATAAEAFYVKCDAENNPPDVRALGQVVIEIGLAPLSPSEFIVVRMVRSVGGAADN
jgi:phage tail sheath protein FI